MGHPRLISGPRPRPGPAGAGLVNTARGALVDTEAALARLRAGAARRSALDVFPAEPCPG
ncbi:MAG: hypothetical protein IPK67_19665 [Planctomycetes bacterium]|nr:hypothetical protein [Planctomycetota bacterium]